MKKILVCLFLLVLLSASGCSADSGKSSANDQSEEDNTLSTSEAGTGMELQEGGGEAMEQFEMENGKTVYLYVPQAVKENPKERVPMVLFMCGTTCDPVENCVDSGWIWLAEKENFIVISPDYNNYATYSETDFLISVVEYMIQNYPVDTERIYSTGFSNGGAASVALTRDYPEYFAAISAMGWMVDLDNKNNVYDLYDMPFQVVQGDGEFTEKTPSGAMMVMDDERDSVRSLFLYNEMIDDALVPDYDAVPYWGYMPDESETVTWDGREWQFNNYYKEGYSVPFAQLVIVEDSEHRPRKEEAEMAWNFFKNFKRNQDGEIEVYGGDIDRLYTDVAYDTLSDSQTLDLYLPETGNGPFPLIVFIHGGGWFVGDKADGQEKAFVALREQGYAVASINYRLSGEAAHPAGLIDCKTAIRFLKANAKQYWLDPERFAVSGDSSGGHYALMVALTAGNPDFEDLTRGYAEENTDVRCAVVWYPATDLAETMRTIQDGEYTGFGADFAWSNIERYVGKTIRNVGDECLVLASPINYISEDMPPVLLQHGNADTICPMDQSQRFYRAAVSVAGEDRVSLTILDGAEHGDSAFEAAENMKTVKAFLDRYLN
mgnify:CR=1 FL=1